MQRPLLAIRAGVQAPDRLITSAWLSISWNAAKPSSSRYFIFYYYNYLMDTRGLDLLASEWHWTPRSKQREPARAR